MYGREFKVNGIWYRRVSKAKARKAYNEGKKVMFCPNNLRPDKPYHMEIITDNKGNEITMESNSTFDRKATEFEIYNCNALTGYYAAYYIE